MPHLPLTQFAHPAWFRYNLAPPPQPWITLDAVWREHISLRLQHFSRKKADVLFGRETTDRKKRVLLKAGVRGEERRRGDDKPNEGLER